MSSNWPKGGPNLVGAYQMSGIPYVTASVAGEAPGAGSGTPVKIELPFVSRFFQIECPDADGLRVGFSEAGTKGTLTSNFIVVTGNSTSPIFELRTKDLYFLSNHNSNTSAFRIIAGLTTISRKQFPALTGSIDGAIAFEGIG